METGKKKQRRTRGALAHKYTEEEWNRVLAVHLTGVWLCMKAEITPLLKQGGGAIVNTSSIMGLTGAIRVPAYTAAKHGVAGITKAAALEYARHGIRINAVRPAPIYTPMLRGPLKNARERARVRGSKRKLRLISSPHPGLLPGGEGTQIRKVTV